MPAALQFSYADAGGWAAAVPDGLAVRMAARKAAAAARMGLRIIRFFGKG
jgi:hypothetical protein